jgi:nitroreductase/NAD-dependent dihydropyrimidine dehydrogenase PreA subunit
MEKIVINADKCLKDGICTEVCPCNIFKPDETGLAQVNEKNLPICINCGHCVSACPSGAITLNDAGDEELERVSTSLPGFEQYKDIVKARRSIRSYKNEPVSDEDIEKLLEITRWAPSAKNSQALSWIAVKGREKVNKFTEAVVEVIKRDEKKAGLVRAFEKGYDLIHRNAPVVLVAHGPEKYSWGTYDASVAVATIEMGARLMNLGSCWGGFSTSAASESKSIARFLGLPEGNKVFAVLMLGKPNFKFLRVPQRKPVDLKIINK